MQRDLDLDHLLPDVGAHNGFGANITIPSMAINGTVVAPGEWFSYWKTVGEVSLAKGYKLGGAIIDGHSVEGKSIGGGICSSSTTLFNAALRAGLQMGAAEEPLLLHQPLPEGPRRDGLQGRRRRRPGHDLPERHASTRS